MNQSWRHPRLFPTRRRPLALLLFGCVYITYGVGLYVSPVPDQLGPRWWPGVLFVTAGLVALGAGVLNRPRNEWVGFTALYVTSIIWALNFCILVIIERGIRSWSGLLVWTFVTALLLLLAGWAEPPRPDVLRDALRHAEQRAEDHNGSRAHDSDEQGQGGSSS